jgi:hypothetical protein
LVFLLVFGFIEIQKRSVYKVWQGGCESLRSAKIKFKVIQSIGQKPKSLVIPIVAGLFL